MTFSTASPLAIPADSCDHCGYSFKKPEGELGKEWPAAMIRTLRELCQQKIEWTLNGAGITDRSRIIDETCCKMSPLLERGWFAGGEQHVHGHAPQHHRIRRHQASRARRMPNSFFRERSPPWNPPRTTDRCIPRATGRRRRPSQPTSHGWTPPL